MYFCEIATWRRIWAVRHLGVGGWDPLVRQKWRQIWKCCLLHNIYILLFNIYRRRLNICGVGFIQYLHMPPSVYLQSYVQRGGRRIWREETLELRRIWVGAPLVHELPCPSAGYRSPPCTWHPPPAASRPYHSCLKTLQGLENSTFYINWEIIKFALIFLGTIRITVETIVVV